MGSFIKTQNSFANGEVSPEFFARDDIHGLANLENMDVLAGGGLSRRKGLAHVADIDAGARLIPFSVSEDQNYLLALTDGRFFVYNDGQMIQGSLAPWQASDLSRLQYAQRFGTMIFVHPDYQPRILKKIGNRFELELFEFLANPDMTSNMPFMKFDDTAGINITVSISDKGNNYATFTTNKDFWTQDDVLGDLFLLGKQWAIKNYISPKVVVAVTNGGYTIPQSPVSNWLEGAFGKKRGWPCSISFHQDRLVFGGSRAWPSGVWMSKVGVHNNFNTGTGLDDEAIFLTLLSEQRQQICTVVSSDNLQILTSAGEWAISNKPLTPSSVNIKQHTDVGSVPARYLPPQTIEGRTVFISGSKKDIRELALDELGENYNAQDLCALSKHLMNDPIDLAYNNETHQLFVVMAGGEMAVLNKNSMLGISAWGIYKTQGQFQSVAVMNGETFVIVQRGDLSAIEKFSDGKMLDCNTYNFSFKATALPILGSKHPPKKIKIRKIAVRVLNTKAVFINGKRAPLPNEVYQDSNPGYTGDVSINLLGTQDDTIKPIWTIDSSEPLPATILSITMYGWYLI